MIKKRKIPNEPVSDFEFGNLDLDICFGPRGFFRYSEFGFYFGGVLAR